MSQANVFANSTTWVGCALETVPGTAQPAPDFWVPVIEPRLGPEIAELTDAGFRGQMNDTWDQVQGPKYTIYEFKCLAHVDVLPNLFRSVLGGIDHVSGSSDPYTHTMAVRPNGQPPTYTWFDYDGFRVRVLRGGQTDRIVFTWVSDGLVEVKVRVFAFPFSVMGGTAPNPLISRIPPTTSWDCSTSIDGTLRTNVVEGSLTLNRHVVAIPTLGQQTPYALFADVLDVLGDTRFLNGNDSELDIYLNNTSVALALNFQNVAVKPWGFTLNMSRCKASAGAQERGTDGLISAILNLLPLPNATDATDGGASAMKATFRSPQPTAY